MIKNRYFIFFVVFFYCFSQFDIFRNFLLRYVLDDTYVRFMLLEVYRDKDILCQYQDDEQCTFCVHLGILTDHFQIHNNKLTH